MMESVAGACAAAASGSVNPIVPLAAMETTSAILDQPVISEPLRIGISSTVQTNWVIGRRVSKVERQATVDQRKPEHHHESMCARSLAAASSSPAASAAECACSNARIVGRLA